MEIKTTHEIMNCIGTRNVNPNHEYWVRVDAVIDMIGYIRSTLEHTNFDLCTDCANELDDDYAISQTVVFDELDKFANKLVK
jgi:hypothetical protein